ncbi:MAG TPA: hypothetical protein VI793_15730 [Anaerolineales bacterium]|nr:hypothetical protein [Anaerolineales bacterium]
MGRFALLRQEVEQRPPVAGIVASDIMDLPENLRLVFNKMARQGPLTVGELAAEFGLAPDEARQIGDGLVAKGYLKTEVREADGETLYRLSLARTRGLRPPPDRS